MEEWLSSIGLKERVSAFRAQGISSDQLGELTDADLRELGLTIGERKRFRRALAARRETVPTRPERRPLTTMFVDIVDSSALGERLEPEDLLEVIQRYREFCGAAITQYAGTLLAEQATAVPMAVLMDVLVIALALGFALLVRRP